MNILLCVPMADKQSGVYMHNTIIQMGHKTCPFDWRYELERGGPQRMNETLISAYEQLKPDLTIVVKGLGIEPKTIKHMRGIHDAPIVGWIFDNTLGGKMVAECTPYIDLIREFDIFYTVDSDAVPELNKMGVKAKHLMQACYPKLHCEQILNDFQKNRYGADIIFIGSLGSIHPNRERILEDVYDEGFYFKTYGEVLYPENKDPIWVKDTHTGIAVTNELHSAVVNSSKIILGCDGWPHRGHSWSLRLYKVLCAGGFYLTTHTKGIEDYFTPGVHLETYNTKAELISKINKYLNDDVAREKIAKAGQELVLKEHTLDKRIQQIINDTKPKDLNS